MTCVQYDPSASRASAILRTFCRSDRTRHWLRSFLRVQRDGAFELQILEELLRRPRSGQTMALLTEVCTKICARIGWPTPVPAAEVVAFLTEFYSAERAFLERERLFGRHREDKNSRADKDSGGYSSAQGG